MIFHYVLSRAHVALYLILLNCYWEEEKPAHSWCGSCRATGLKFDFNLRRSQILLLSLDVTLGKMERLTSSLGCQSKRLSIVQPFNYRIKTTATTLGPLKIFRGDQVITCKIMS